MKITAIRPVRIEDRTDLREYTDVELDQEERANLFPQDEEFTLRLVPGLMGWPPYTHTMHMTVDEDTWAYHVQIKD